jgi:transcriptional regulator with XRE-family HTH domain
MVQPDLIPPPAIKFGSTLSQLIQTRGFKRTRKKVCAAIGITPSALSQYERSLSLPSLQVAIKLAAFFEVSLDYLMLGEDRTPHQ